ncbi:MAG: outer rane transport energization protein ExbD [Candidatus Angelobacter sp.]|jgi:biopolymer transport protein TolR|nr:outer rane transport energization protein ExbD [Candidatus Angelobacter sp.]
MGMGLSSGGGMKPEINVTPLIDVLLVLMIIFMMIQPQNKFGLEAQVPQPPPSNSAPPPETTVVLELSYQQSGPPKITINQSTSTWEELRARLAEIYKTRAEKIMFVKGDDKLAFSDVAAAIDIAREADRDIRIGLITRDLQHGD